ncbi:MAG: A/G-specific adenine glycosylase [Terriglobia bacterium]|jgi:A/G-specific adenine glycosylase
MKRMNLTHQDEAAIRSALLAWFRRNARSLPWRGSGDPYAVWVSEVMLQQTQVATVIPYYQRFLETFPTVADLASASLERVLQQWSGLGYYRRARHLHQAAKQLVRSYGGSLPRDYDKIRSLAGVGDYTARAILSIAFNLPFTVLDGNVARVVSRVAAVPGNLHQPGFRRAVEAELERLLSRHRPGRFNQALMELGQTICLPRAPQCAACPVRGWCLGYKTGHPEVFPQPRPRRAAESHYLAAAILRRGPRVAMVRGLDDGLLDDLWNFPSAFGRSSAEALEGLRDKLAGFGFAALTRQDFIAELHHGITYRSICVRAYAAEISDVSRKKGLRWFPISSLGQAAISQLARKIARQVF